MTPRSGVDTHIGVCPKCGSRNLVDGGFGNPVEEGAQEGLWLLFAGFWWWLAGKLLRRPTGGDDGEVNVRLRCRDCGRQWRP